MRPDLKALRHLSDLDRLLDDSAGRPVLLFKHSYSCGTSAEALDELIEHLDDARRREARLRRGDRADAPRRVERRAATRLGVRHETPQALLIRDGRVVWSASHFRVTADAVAKAIEHASSASATSTRAGSDPQSRRSSPPRRSATIRPSKSPSRQSRTSSGATRRRSSPGSQQEVGVGRLAARGLRAP